MRNLFSVLLLLVCVSSFCLAQSSAPAKPAASTDPTAIIHTTVGDLHCTLFPKIAPLGVANFIGLANGTKDWTSPIGHVKKHGVPLYLSLIHI